MPMSYSRVWVLELSKLALEKLNKKRCPKCDHELQVTVLGGAPQIWTCENCRTEFTTVKG